MFLSGDRSAYHVHMPERSWPLAAVLLSLLLLLAAVLVTWTLVTWTLVSDEPDASTPSLASTGMRAKGQQTDAARASPKRADDASARQPVQPDPGVEAGSPDCVKITLLVKGTDEPARNATFRHPDPSFDWAKASPADRIESHRMNHDHEKWLELFDRKRFGHG